MTKVGFLAPLTCWNDLPIVAGDLAMYRATLTAMGAKPRNTGRGRLLDDF
ncbi:MAG: hypothetical protein OXE50_10775 [Chloroflexi bacterium]|nr:hypothetical protein [Chloroflexota bacterium]